MSSFMKMLIIIFIGNSLLSASSKMYQKYGVESGKIDYKITGSMEMMGIMSQTLGKREMIFSQYGIKELKDERKVVKQNGAIDKSHTATYIDRSLLYRVNFDTKKIVKMEIPGMAMMGLSDENSAQQAGLKILKQMGGKKIGSDEVLGYSCDLWELMGTKQCIYKGIPLRVESDIMGVKSSEVATKIEFDVNIPDQEYALPQFPIYDMEGNEVPRSSLAMMDNKSDREIAQSSEDMATLGASLVVAMQSAGVSNDQTPTKVQEQKIQESMMTIMLPRMKEKFLSQEKVMLFGKECFSRAETLKAANICNQKANEMSGEEEEAFDSWNPSMKKEILNSLGEGLKAIECMKKANSMEAIRKCVPQE